MPAMRLIERLFGHTRPTRVATVYWTRESALAAVDAALADANADDVEVRIVGPLEQVIGNEPAPGISGAWAVVVQPATYEQCRRIVRALRQPLRRRRGDHAPADAASTSPAAPAELVTGRS